MSDIHEYVIDLFSVLPPLSHCRTLTNSQISTLCKGLYTLTVDDQLQQLCSTLTGDPDRASKLDNLRDLSAYLSGIERNLKIDWNETNIENPSILINAVCSVWLAGKKLVTIREEIHSIISYNEAFDQFLFIAVKLHYLTGRLISECKQLHATAAPRALPALKSILKTCPSISGNLRIIKNLIKMKPVCNILQDANPSYMPSAYDVDELRKKATDFQTQYASLSDDLERYLSICRYTKLKEQYDEILLIGPDEDFDLNDFEECLSNIQDTWDLGLNDNLDLYVIQLDFLSICDKFQNELSLGSKFLRKHECSKYPDIDTMLENKNSILNSIFSSHWINSQQQTEAKLMDYVKQFSSVISEDEELEIFNLKTAMKLVQHLNDFFYCFTELYRIMIKYYDLGIEERDEFHVVRNIDDDQSKKVDKHVEIYIKQFRINSQSMLVFAGELEAAFTQKVNTTIRDSSVLETQCNIWELLILGGQNFLTLNLLQEKLPIWQKKMDALCNEFHNSTSTANSINKLDFEPQLIDYTSMQRLYALDQKQSIRNLHNGLQLKSKLSRCLQFFYATIRFVIRIPQTIIKFVF